ncbi:discoidin domain-containing protein, partial [Candidatus Ozemobacteraceae bacterium]|nr:discoidin domain-containing protein [Candidatus Ozemobacteraceae bacterium]
QGMKSLTIEGADSAGGPWTLLGNVTVPESDVFNTVLNIPNTIPYQCYKITCTDNHGGVLAWVQREFRFYLAGVRKISPTMTSANAPAPASVVAQTEVGGSGWKIFDGNTATWWETSGVTSAWVRIDLGGVEIVDIIRVRGQGSGVAETTRNFKIQACNDDASWVDISGSLEKPKNGTWDIFCLSNTTPYRYYRFVNESVYGGSQIKCPEVEFYSTQSPPTESPLLPGAYMTKTLGDDNSTVILRHSHAGCMTPYGPVIGGGVTPSGATSSVQIYWPHAIASGTPADPPAVPPTPTFWYAFDEISGTTAADSSEGLHPGALTGFSAPGCWISGRHGNGLNFDGIDDHIPTAAPAVLTALNNITMAAWVKRTGSTGTNQMILVNGNTSTQGYALFIDSSGVVKVVCGGVGFADSGYSIVNDTWTHLAAVRVAGTWKMFVNGGEVAVTGNPVPNAISPGVTRVGCNQSGTEPFKGVLDDVVFYDRALPVTEIKALMDLGPVEPSTPLACLRFDETAGNTAVDSSGNGFDGTLNSMTSPGCWVAGRKNTCLAFDGSNDNVTLSALTGDIVSICFWMKEETTTLTDWSGPFCQAANDSSGFQFRSSALVAGCYSLKIGGSEYPTSIPDNDKAWKHIAIVKEGSATKIYYDGALNTTAAAVWTTAGAVRLGSNGLNDRWWNGKIDDLIIYDRVLSQVEIRKIMEGARPYFFGISRELPPMPGKRMNHSLVWHKDKLYRVGGSDGTNILATVDRFDPGTNVWVQLAQTALESDIADKSKFLDPSNLFKRQCAGACSFGNEIFIFGGENPAATLLTSAAAWNPETNRVRKVKEIPAQILWSGGSGNATKGINAVPVGPFIYLMGGSTGSNNGTSKQILRYRP